MQLFATLSLVLVLLTLEQLVVRSETIKKLTKLNQFIIPQFLLNDIKLMINLPMTSITFQVPTVRVIRQPRTSQTSTTSCAIDQTNCKIGESYARHFIIHKSSEHLPASILSIHFLSTPHSPAGWGRSRGTSRLPVRQHHKENKA